MKHPFLRILFLFVTIAAISSLPLFLDGAGVSHISQFAPIANQDVVGGIVIKSKDEVEVGELVRLDASESDVEGLTWKIIPSTPDFEVIENGRRAFFSARTGGSYLIIIAAAKAGVPYLEHCTIEVIGEEPTPGPESLTSSVRKWTKDIVNYDGKKTHGLAMAQVFRKLATAEDVTVEQILEATATANSAVLGDSLDKWMPLLEPLGKELDIITEAGGLTTREQYKDVWLKIAEGIEKGV